MGEQLTILVADDEPLLRQSLRVLLSSAGYRVREAGGASEALTLMESDPPSLVISDINMPGNEDLAFVRTLAEKYPGLPVVVLTAFPSMQTAIDSVNLAVVGYLVKPPNASELLGMVQQAVGRYEARDAIQRSLVRLGDWKRDLQRLESIMAGPRSAAEVKSSSAYLELTLRHVMTSLSDLHRVVSMLAGTSSGPESIRAAELSNAVQETMEVLGRTRRVFNSNDLGELREKLEAVLSAAGTSPGIDPRR